MCRFKMSAARARCPDCGQSVQVPYTWCDEDGHGFLDEKGRLDDAFAHRLLLEHARQKPILHPLVLQEQHLTIGKPA